MNRPYYVFLTGCKNNAGDYYIAHRARQILGHERPDREIVEFDAWEPIDDERLEIVNGAEALLLTGGPALRSDIFPGIYRLRQNLDDIRPPIIPFGIGWKDRFGSWERTRLHDLSGAASPLIDRISGSGYLGSVRDYHSNAVFAANGISNILVTGCPGLYDPQRFDTRSSNGAMTPIGRGSRVAFSPGVELARNEDVARVTRSLISRLAERFSESEFIVAFHHALDAGSFEKAYGELTPLFRSQTKLAEWLNSRGIAYQDISGGAEPLLALYSTCDLHVGYRVHAHIAMTSLGRRSILIAEDGRGIALRDVLGGIVVAGFSERSAISRRPGDLAIWRKPEGYLIVPDHFEEDVLERLDYSLTRSDAQFEQSFASVHNHLPIMQRFLAQLP